MNSYNSLQEIISAFPGCTQDILVCKNCSNSNIFATLLGNNMSQYCWCESLVCTQCSYQWYLCKICDSSRQMSKKIYVITTNDIMFVQQIIILKFILSLTMK